MRAGLMSAGIFGITDRATPLVKEQRVQEKIPTYASEWSEKAFARQQIRNLVRQVFSPGGRAVQHVVFSGVEMDADVNGICWSVGETLARERSEDVLVLISDQIEGAEGDENWATHLRSRAKRMDRNLWRLSVQQMDGKSEMRTDGLRALMAEVRRQFEFSVVADSVSGWMRRASLAEAADGLVLVLSALKTRRAIARKMLDELSHVRLLGTVLQDREFPIPEGIYHRL